MSRLRHGKALEMGNHGIVYILLLSSASCVGESFEGTGNHAPTIAGTPATSVTVGAAYDFTPAASDADADDALTFAITREPSWASFDATNGRLHGTPSTGDVGVFADIVISVSDAESSASLDAFTITVSDLPGQSNHPPTIGGVPAAHGTVGAAYDFRPAASDADADDTLTFSITHKPSWASFDTTNGRLHGTPSAGDVGVFGDIVISVSDATTSVSLAPFSVTVNATSEWPYLFIPNPTVYHAQANPDPWSVNPLSITDPGRPAAWDSNVEEPGYYYIDLGNSTGEATNTGRPYGTPVAPRLTFPKRTFRAADGDVRIEVTGTHSAYLTLTLQGLDEDHMVWLVGDPNRAPPSFTDFRMTFGDWQYAVAENLDRSGPAGENAQGGLSFEAINEDAHHSILRNITVHDIGHRRGGKSGIAIQVGDQYKKSGGQVYSNLLYNLTFYNLGNDYDWMTADNDFHAISFNSFLEDNTTGWQVRNNWILDCYGTAVSGNVVQITGQGPTAGSPHDTLRYVYLSRLTGVANRQPVVGVKTCSHAIISQCKSEHNRAEAGGQGDAYGGQYNYDDVWFIANEGWDSERGLRMSDQNNTGTDPPETHQYWIGNLFYDIQNYSDVDVSWSQRLGGTALYFMRGNTPSKQNRYIAFNTVAFARAGVGFKQGSGPADNPHSNNVWANIIHIQDTHLTPGDSPRHIILGTPVASYVSSDDNLYAASAGGQSFSALFNSSEYTTLADWAGSPTAGAELRDQHSVIGNADWVNANTDPSTRDYNIGTNSDARGLGSWVAPNGVDIAAEFYNQYGLDLKLDFEGRPRDATHPDAGAFEFQGP